MYGESSWEVILQRKPSVSDDAHKKKWMMFKFKCVWHWLFVMLHYLPLFYNDWLLHTVIVSYLCVCIDMVCKSFAWIKWQNVCKLLNKPNHISYLRGAGMTLIFATMKPLFQNATTSIHFQSALSNRNNWFCLFSTSEKRLWLNILSPNLNSKIPINTWAK